MGVTGKHVYTKDRKTYFNVDEHLASLVYHPVQDKIAAITCYFNPHRGKNRTRCFDLFSKQFPQLGMDLFVAEGAINERFELNTCNNYRVHQYDMDGEACLFAKENLLNLLINRLPDKYEYVAWIDCDVIINKNEYADLISEQLSIHDTVQLFKLICYLGKDSEIITKPRSGLAFYNESTGQRSSSPFKAYPGFGWAARRSFISDIGGIYDKVITGGGDVAFVASLYGDLSANYINNWSTELVEDVQRYVIQVQKYKPRISFVDVVGMHVYHGSLTNRMYTKRNEMLKICKFDPTKHLSYNSNGTIKWSEEAPHKLKESVTQYMLGRKEDE